MPMVVAISENGGLILVAWIYCIHDLSLLNLLIALRFETEPERNEREVLLPSKIRVTKRQNTIFGSAIKAVGGSNHDGRLEVGSGGRRWL
ncbi:hypothetical protein L1887_16323 [Cichorium endivia]|nr:hypothetical protein L1887_16323 [Cichorium endivia]